LRIVTFFHCPHTVLQRVNRGKQAAERKGWGMMREEVAQVGELILLFVVAVYFCYGFYALNRECGFLKAYQVKDFCHRARLRLKQLVILVKRKQKIKDQLPLKNQHKG
jgi:hypothetical protein